jgi:hypothetical protein
MNNQIEMLDHVLGELQRNVARRAVEFFRFGWVILAGCVAHFILAYIGAYNWIQAVWIVVPILCTLLGVVSGMKRSNRYNKSISEKLLINIWAVVGLVMIYLSFIAPRLGLFPDTIVLPLVMTLMFISIILTGLTIKHPPTIVLSFLWFAGSIVAAILPLEYYVHILTVVVVLGYLLPAYLIKVKFK